MRIMKKNIAKKCKICDKLLHNKNKSGLCGYHYALNWMKGGKNGNKT